MPDPLPRSNRIMQTFAKKFGGIRRGDSNESGLGRFYPAQAGRRKCSFCYSWTGARFGLSFIVAMDDVLTWCEAPETLSLATGEVHVWRLALDQPESVLTEFRRALDADEIERAGRFHFEKHQRHFVAGRGGLRYVLSRYLDVKPEELRFSYGAFGKPALIGEELRFNMSHSHGLALFAVSGDRELGVDVEHVRADFASEDIARRFFSTVEVAAFNALPKEEQVAAFFRCWTRKEAYIKAIGRGDR